ncbi:MAG: transcription antitermination factor NusB, partial [Victivallaceae bacterium]
MRLLIMKNSSNSKESVADSILSGAIKGLELWEDDGIGLDDYLDFYLKPADVRRTVSSILFEYFRNKALIDRVILNSVTRPPQARYHRILAVVLTQAFFQSGISPESAANVAVDHVKAKYGKSPAGFINAVLRTALRNDIKTLMSNSSAPEFLFPASVFKRWKARFSDEVLIGLADGLRAPASLTFRLCKDIPEELLAEADAVALTDLPWLGNLRFYECSSPGKIFTQPWLNEGKIYIQDPSTALAPGMAELNGNEKILDMCAAPGGKSLILAERLGKDGKLVAADRSEQRQALTRENFK